MEVYFQFSECRYILCKDNANRVQRKINLFIFKMYPGQ